MSDPNAGELPPQAAGGGPTTATIERWAWLQDSISEPGIRAVRAVAGFFFHAVAMAAAVLMVRFVEWMVWICWGVRDLYLYGRFPLSWLLQTIDAGLIAVFGYYGIKEAIKQHRRDVP